MPFKIEDGKIKPLKLSSEEVLEAIRKEKVKFVDLQFTDVPGKLQHTTIYLELEQQRVRQHCWRGVG